MFKKIMMASLAVGALALGAPVAQAAPGGPTYDCGFNSVQQTDATGQNYEGAAYGYVIDPAGSAVTIWCQVEVNGSPAGSPTPTGTGTGAAATAGRVTFTAQDTDDVKLCANGTINGVPFHDCGDSTHTQVPPQEVIDALEGLLTTLDGILIPLEQQFVDPVLCAVLDLLPAGVYGPIGIGEDGDVSLDGELFWDCPPYV